MPLDRPTSTACTSSNSSLQWVRLPHCGSTQGALRVPLDQPTSTAFTSSKQPSGPLNALRFCEPKIGSSPARITPRYRYHAKRHLTRKQSGAEVARQAHNLEASRSKRLSGQGGRSNKHCLHVIETAPWRGCPSIGQPALPSRHRNRTLQWVPLACRSIGQQALPSS